MEKIYLSRRNLRALLSKLDRKKNGEHTECAIVKYRNPGKFQQTIDSITVIAVENEEYYENREPGTVFFKDSLHTDIMV